MPLRLRQPRMSATNPAGSSAGSSSRRNEICGCAVVTTTGASMDSPPLPLPCQRHPGHPAVLGADLRDLGVGPDLRPEHPGGPGQRPGHAAHAAAREAPGARRPFGLADVMVQHHVRGPGRPRPGPGADHPGHRQQAEHRVALEVPLEQVGDAAGEQPRHVDRAAFVDAAQAGAAAAPAAAGPAAAATRAAAGSGAAAGRAPADAGQVLLVPGIRVGVGARRTWRSRRAAAPGRRAAAGTGRRPAARSRVPAGTRGSRAAPGAGRGPGPAAAARRRTTVTSRCSRDRTGAR